MVITYKDIFSPANALSFAGLLLTLYGAWHITTLAGVLILGLGRFIDIFDGIVARRTHASDFGAAVDAIFDKIGMAALVIAMIIGQLAPFWVIGYVLLQNLLNVVYTAIARFRGIKTVSLKAGKKAMFLQNIALGSFALGAVLSFGLLEYVGYIITVISLYFAYNATRGYFRVIKKQQTN